MTKTKKLPWFRVYSNCKQAVDATDSKKVGEAFKEAFKYFETGEEPYIIDPETRLLFFFLKQGIDESIEEYEARKADGKKGAEARRKKQDAATEAKINKLMDQYGGNEPIPTIQQGT